MKRSYYDALGVSESATAEEIRAAYRRLIQRYHPDHNPDPHASEITVQLNEAYTVLSDDRKRAVYDAWLRSERTTRRPSAATAGPEPAQEPIPDYRCARCGRQDSSLRLTLMYYVVSVVFMTYRRGASDIWCSRCRTIEAAKWTLLSCAAGWWGFPWGPIYTLHAIFKNALGGDQPRSQNAILLRVLGFVLYSKGDHRRARTALRESLRLERNDDASRLYDYLNAESLERGTEPDYWKWATAAPALAFVLLAGFFIYHTASKPVGYQARYQPPRTLPSTDAIALPTDRRSARARVNDLVDQLARIVGDRAPVVGSHYEGSTLIKEHVLDRSKFSSEDLYRLAESIRSELGAERSDPDGFLASSYFNASLLALSVDIVNRLREGKAIQNDVERVIELGKNERVHAWLESSKYWPHYQDLIKRLRRYRRYPVSGKPTHELEAAFKDAKARLNEVRSQMDGYPARGDIDEYNKLVPVYNAIAERANRSAGELEFRSGAVEKLDLAFNRCLDTSILMSRFHRVDLTSRAAEIDAQPEPTE